MYKSANPVFLSVQPTFPLFPVSPMVLTILSLPSHKRAGHGLTPGEWICGFHTEVRNLGRSEAQGDSNIDFTRKYPWGVGCTAHAADKVSPCKYFSLSKTQRKEE